MSKSKGQVVGYRYWIGLHMLLGHGVADKIIRIRVQKKDAWIGENTGADTDGKITINEPSLFGGLDREGGIVGDLEFKTGEQGQVKNDYLQGIFGATDAEMPLYERVISVFLEQVEIGLNPYLKPWDFLVQRIYKRSDDSAQWNAGTAGISSGITIQGTGTLSEVAPGQVYDLSSQASTNSTTAFNWVAREYYVVTAGAGAGGDALFEVFDMADNTLKSSLTIAGTFVPNSADTMWYDVGSTLILMEDSGGLLEAFDPSDGSHDISVGLFGTTQILNTSISYSVGGVLHVSNIEPLGLTDWQIKTYKQNGTGWTDMGNGGATTLGSLNSPIIMGMETEGTTSSFFFFDNTNENLERVTITTSTVTSAIIKTGFPGSGDELFYAAVEDIILRKDGATLVAYNNDGPTYTQKWSMTLSDALVAFPHPTLSRVIERIAMTSSTNFNAIMVNLVTGFEEEIVAKGSWSTINRSLVWDDVGGALWSMRNSNELFRIQFSPLEQGILHMNPAHIIRDAFQDPTWGSNTGDAKFGTSWEEAATTLFNEKFGLSLEWKRQTSINDFIQYILSHIDAYTYIDPFTGLRELKLIRDDYVIGNLITLNENDIVGIEGDFERVDPTDSVNSVTVTYTDTLSGDDRSVTYADDILIQETGVLRPSSVVDYRGVQNTDLAARLAKRDLLSLSSPLAKGTIIVNKLEQVRSLLPGEPFILNVPRLQINNEVMRALTPSYDGSEGEQVKIQFISDVFFLDTQGVRSDDGVIDVGGVNEPQPVTPRLAIEAPFYAMAQELGESDSLSRLETNPELGFVFATGPQPTQDSINIRVHSDLGQTGTFIEQGGTTFIQAGSLDADLSAVPTVTAINITDINNMAEVVAGDVAMIDQEIITIESWDSGTGAAVIKRGCLDTIPAAHTAGANILVWADGDMGDETEYGDADVVDVKLITSTPLGELALSDAATDTITFNSRANRSYPVGDFQADTTQIGEVHAPIDGGDVVLSWAHRDRTTQTGVVLDAYTAGDIGPEAGVTYQVIIEWLDSAMAIISTPIDLDNGTTTSYTFTGYAIPATAAYVRFKVRSKRDTTIFEWQTPTIVAIALGDNFRLTAGSADIRVLADGTTERILED